MTRRYYSGLSRFKRKRRTGYWGMPRMTMDKEQILAIGNRDTRKRYRQRLPNVIPDVGYINLEVSGTTPGTYQPLSGDDWVVQEVATINRIYNVFDEPAGSFGISVQGYDQWAQFYDNYRVEAITFRVRAIMPAVASGNTVQLIMNPRAADEDPIDPNTDSMAFIPSRDRVRSIIVNADDSSTHTLTYQASLPSLTGVTMGEDPGYEASFQFDDDPQYLRVMDILIYNLLEDGNFDPIKLEYKFEYHCRFSEKKNLELSEAPVQAPKPGARVTRIKGRERIHGEITRDTRDEVMSVASSTVSGFSQLMAAKTKAARKR